MYREIGSSLMQGSVSEKWYYATPPGLSYSSRSNLIRTWRSYYWVVIF